MPAMADVLRFSLFAVVIIFGARPGAFLRAQPPASLQPESRGTLDSPTSLNSPQQPGDIPLRQPSALASPDKKTPGQRNGNNQSQTAGTSNDRLFFAFPNFLTLEQAGEVPPLTAKQKFAVVTRGSFDYVKFIWYGALAGIGQAENSPDGYRQGAAGYGKRYGAAFGDSTIEDYMTGAILPSVLHQDPRYFQLGKGGFWHRTGYALSRSVITRGDSGHNQFNFSEILGGGAQASISTFSYYPRNDRTASNVMTVWGTQMGLDAFVTVLREFWPDIRRKLQGKSDPAVPTK